MRYKIIPRKKEMKLIYKTLLMLLLPVTVIACYDDADFSSDASLRLDFSSDEISFDTIFTELASPSNGVMVYNRNSKALQINTVELLGGSESGFRVLVDGQYGTLMHDFELRSKDSLYLFAEVTPPANGASAPIVVEDVVRFTLASGVQQDIRLVAYGRDAEFMRAVTVNSDSTIKAGHYVVYDSLVVAPGAALTIEAGAILYFHDKVPMTVRGSVVAAGTKEQPVVFRGDRTDNMFSYLPYDRVPGQWGGITIAATSNGNRFEYSDIHSANYGIKVEPGDTTVQRLAMNGSRLENFYGHALEMYQAHATVTNTLVANAGGNCVKIVGGKARFVHCTIANFFVYKVRDVALTLHNSYGTTPAPLYGADFVNCIVTGVKKDELMGYLSNLGDTVPYCKNYHFENSLINTVVGDDENFVNVRVDSSDEPPFASDHFVKIDHDLFLYDFHLNETSPARSMGSDAFVSDPLLMYDKDGVLREPASVDVGCYNYVNSDEEGAE